MKHLIFVFSLFCLQDAAFSAPELPNCRLPKVVEKQFYGMIHYVEVPQGDCKYLGGSLEPMDREECSNKAVLANSQCYQVTKTKIMVDPPYSKKTYNCWGCLLPKP